jgi:predicted DNA-binding transcriptional regulator AlpA
VGLKLLTTKHLAIMLNLSVTTIKKKRVHKPDSLPPFIKIGNSYRYDESTISTWLKNQESQQIIKEQKNEH